MLFKYSNPELVFAQSSIDKRAFWAALLEKAWAKVKGNYVNSEGGLIENGLHSLVGVPVFRYETQFIISEDDSETAFEMLRSADAAGFLMGAGTSGSGNN